MTGDSARLVKYLAVDLIEEITSAPTDALEWRVAYQEGRWLARAFGDLAVDDPWSDLSVETCLFMVRTIRSARRMRRLELQEMAIAAMSA